MKVKNPIVLDHGKLVPLTIELLVEKVERNNRIDLVMLYAKLQGIDFVQALPLVNRTHMRLNRVLQLFGPWLGFTHPRPEQSFWREFLQAITMRFAKNGSSYNLTS